MRRIIRQINRFFGLDVDQKCLFIVGAGVAGADDGAASGQHDSGWIDQGNGTYVRRKSSWSRNRAESSVGGVQLKPEDIDELSQHYAQGQVIHGGEDDLNAVDVDGHAREAGDHGRNSTGNYPTFVIEI